MHRTQASTKCTVPMEARSHFLERMCKQEKPKHLQKIEFNEALNVQDTKIKAEAVPLWL